MAEQPGPGGPDAAAATGRAALRGEFVNNRVASGGLAGRRRPLRVGIGWGGERARTGQSGAKVPSPEGLGGGGAVGGRRTARGEERRREDVPRARSPGRPGGARRRARGQLRALRRPAGSERGSRALSCEPPSR